MNLLLNILGIFVLLMFAWNAHQGDITGTIFCGAVYVAFEMRILVNELIAHLKPKPEKKPVAVGWFSPDND